ncbi:MAG: glycosyltransferase family 2 protein [Desulforhopalus sp.]
MSHCPVSVIIPTYNRSTFLPRALNSVVRQTWRCGEIIVVDDGSTDATPQLLEEIVRQGRMNLRVFYQDNKGPGAARNLAIEKAGYPYIAFLDSDDHWQKRKLEIQYQALQKATGYHVSHTFEKWLRRGLHLNQKKIQIPRHGDIFGHCLRLCGVGMSTVLMKKDLLQKVGGFDESLRCCEDYDLWLRISSKYPFLLIGESLSVKEGGREDQVSYKYRLGMDRLRIYSLEKLLNSDLLSPEQHILTFMEFERKVNIYGHGCLKHDKEDTGKHFLELIPYYRDKGIAKYPQLERSFYG